MATPDDRHRRATMVATQIANRDVTDPQVLDADIASEVWTVERHQRLADGARERLEALGYRNVHVLVGDGAQGHPPAAPFDAIVEAAAAATIPDQLIEQLAAGGRLVIPVDRGDGQGLVRVRWTGSRITRESRGRVRFVPLITEPSTREPEA